MTYWILSLTLVSFGIIGAFSIGRPFFLIGLTMLLLGRWRRRPAVFWPPMLAMMAYNIVFWATVPLSCTATQSIGPGSAAGASTTVCSNLLGVTWSARGIFNPSSDPAHQTALIAAGLAFVVALVTVRVRNANREQGEM